MNSLVMNETGHSEDHVNPKLITREEMSATIGIGASQVAGILNLSPFPDDNAYNQWAIKTGRRPKPPQTPAMLFGIEMEPQGIECWRKQNLKDGETLEVQVAAVDRNLEFLRAIADIWEPVGKRLVNVKCPSSRRTMNEVRGTGRIPQHYLLQGAAEMTVFGVEEWELFVWHSDKDYASVRANWGTPIQGMPLGDFWTEVAVPELRVFWKRILDDAWTDSTAAAQIEEGAWLAAIARRENAKKAIEEAETQKMEADAEIRRLMGLSEIVNLGGWKASWTSYKPKLSVVIDVETKEKLDAIFAAVSPLENSEGVRAVKINEQPESKRFSLREVKQ